MRVYSFEDSEGTYWHVPQPRLWEWLKAERRWKDKVHQWLRAEGVSNHVLILRRAGQPEQPHRINRAARRRMTKNWKRVAV